MESRNYAASAWDFFWRSIAYSRTRLIYQWDYLLLRPGTHGVLALIDVFFRENLYAIGVLSIFWHALTVFSLYLVLARWISRVNACLLSLLLLVQGPGLEMVFWRHISPYLLGLFFFNLGLYFLVQPKAKEQRNEWVVSVLFFLSSLFHELMLIVLAVCAIVFALAGRSDRAQTGRLLRMCLIPIGLTLICSAVEIYYKFQFFFAYRTNPLDRSLFQTSIPSVLSNLTYLGGLVLAVFVNPAAVRITFRELTQRGYWNFTLVPAHFYQAAGIVLFAALILLFIYWLRQLRDQDERRPAAAALITIVYLGVILVGLTLARVIPRSLSYLYTSTYYYYMTSLAIIILCAVSAKVVCKMFPALTRWRKVATACVFAFCIIEVILSYRVIQATLQVRAQSDRAVADAALSLTRAMRQHPGYCYAGTTSGAILKQVPLLLFFRAACSDRADQDPRKPLYLIEHPDGTLWFSEIEKNSGVAVTTRHARWVSDQIMVFSETPESRPLVVTKHLLSDKTFNPVSFSAKILKSVLGGLIVKYQDVDNFVMLIANERYFYTHVMREGVRSAPLFAATQVFNKDEFRLTIQKVGDQYHVFYNDRKLLSTFSGIGSLEGGVGLHAFRQPGEPARLYDDVMLQETTPNADPLYRFEPKFEFVFDLSPLKKIPINRPDTAHAV